MSNIFENKIILVTGGVGSIGSKVVEGLLNYNPKQIRIFDNRETEEFAMQNNMAQHPNLRFLIGDVRDKNRLKIAMENVDMVFHAAALKHVPGCEYNPFEAVKTNVYGTQNVIDCALENNVERVINISTDKVTNAINTLGATKLLAERLITTARHYHGGKRTLFCSVRFGNVLKSRGSVIEIFEEQIKNGNHITITNHNMTRFFISVQQAVNLVFKATELMQGGEIFILKMPAIKLQDLAEVMIEELAPRYNKKPDQIQSKIVGVRLGERMYEDLMTEEEAEIALETDELFVVIPSRTYLHSFEMPNHSYPNAVKAAPKRYSTMTTKLLTKEELYTMLKRENII